MKKQYEQPSMHIVTVKTLNNILTTSNISRSDDTYNGEFD
jgi:hypothetical protein